jgi:hypothetical protein
MTIGRMKFAWKYRRLLWKYRKLLAHRREIAGALVAGAAAIVVFYAAHSPRPSCSEKASLSPQS